MNDGLFISQEKSYEKSNENLFCSYSIISSLFKHKKSEIFHFSRSTKNFNPSSLDCGLLGGSILCLKKIRDTLGLFSIGNSHFDNTFVFIPTKLF